MVTLYDEKVDNSICYAELKDGQIGVIICWRCKDYVGRIVQRVGKDLITLGGDSGNVFPNLMKSEFDGKEQCRVRVLPPGTLLKI